MFLVAEFAISEILGKKLFDCEFWCSRMVGSLPVRTCYESLKVELSSIPDNLPFSQASQPMDHWGKLTRKRSAVCSYGEPEPLGIDENLNNVTPGVHALAIEARVHKLLISSIKSRTNAAALELLSGYIRR